MTPKTQASRIVQKHYDIIESHLPIHSMTDTQMMKIAKEHAKVQVKSLVENEEWRADLYADDFGNVFASGVKYWNFVLDEIETI